MPLPIYPSQVAPSYTWRVVSGVTVNGTVKALDANPDRVALIICSTAASNIRFTPDGSASVTNNIGLQASNANTILAWHDVGALVTSEWYVNDNVGLTSWSLIEVIYRPLPRVQDGE